MFGLFIGGNNLTSSANSDANAIAELIEIEFMAFPNPTKGRVTVSSDLDIIQINIYSVEGKLLSIHNSRILNFDVPGTYFARIITKQGSAVKKLIVK